MHRALHGAGATLCFALLLASGIVIALFFSFLETFKYFDRGIIVTLWRQNF